MLKMAEESTQRETAAGWYRRFYSSDYITLLHFPFASSTSAFTVIGAAMAPIIHVDRLIVALVLVFLAHESSHYLDETRGHPWNTKIPNSILYTFGLSFMAISIIAGLYLLITVSFLLVIFFIPLVFLPFTYSMELWGGRFHKPWNYGLSGGLICLGSYFLQTLTITLAPILMAVAIGIQCILIIIVYENTKRESTRTLAWQTLKGIILIWIIIAIAMLVAGRMVMV